MNIYFRSWLCAALFITAPALGIRAADDPAATPLRMANGVIIEGAVLEATPDGLVIQGEKGKYTAPWKYLSTGTRNRYELPMLAALEAERALALKKAQEEAARKAAAEKAAAAKAAGTNIAGTASNPPPAKK